MTAIHLTKPQAIDNWQAILWREWAACGDGDYARRLYQAVYAGPLSWLTRWQYRFQPRPYAHQVEAALYTACERRGAARYVWQRRLERLEQEKEKNTPSEDLIAGLSDHHWLKRFIARHMLFYRGGMAVPALQRLVEAGIEQATALWLLESIAVDTSTRLMAQAHRLLCPDCLTYCYRHELILPDQLDLVYYGCRLCRRSRDFRTRGEDIAVVLDNRKLAEWRLEKDGQLGINWLIHRELFDFGWVEIMQATDEDVERFAVQVGNDTDPFRRTRYPDMTCFVSQQSGLSENTLRILERIFGTVELVETLRE